MRVLIAVDIEGVAGVNHPQQGQSGNGEHELARRLMTQEANAAVRGVLAAGAESVIVTDSHGDFRNLLPTLLHPQAQLLSGRPRAFGMIAGVPQCQVLLLVGFHAMAQAPGVLSHTISGKSFARIRINGQDVGEAFLYGALAAELGVPLLMCSGDDAFAAETQVHFPHTRFVVVKQALGHRSALHLSPEAACAAIEAGAKAALQAHLQSPVPPLPWLSQTARPLVCEVQAQSPALADLFAITPLVERVNGTTLRFEAGNMDYLLRVLNTLSAMGMGLN